MLAQNFDSIQQEAGITPPQDLGSLISVIFKEYIFYAAGIALLIYLILGGFQLMLSRGDPKAIEGGKGKITNAIIGFVIIFASYWLVKLLGRVFGIADFF
jgi:hypothetical protein